MAHDFINFPELTNSQMNFYYFESPHKQITEDFRAEVAKVIDGDTIVLRTDFRDFDFELRLLDIDAPEMSEPKGKEVREWLAHQIEGEQVDIKINKDRRVGKYGRLLGRVISKGINMGNMMMRLGLAQTFGKKTGLLALPNLNKELIIQKWL